MKLDGYSVRRSGIKGPWSTKDGRRWKRQVVRGDEEREGKEGGKKKDKGLGSLIEKHFCHQGSSPRNIIHILHCLWIKHRPRHAH